MKLFDKIRSELDKNIEADSNREESRFELIDKFSVKNLFDGRIVSRKIIKQFGGMFVLLMVLSFVFINNRYQYERSVRENNILKEEKIDLENIQLVELQKIKELSTRTSVIQKLKEVDSKLSEPLSPPIKID